MEIPVFHKATGQYQEVMCKCDTYYVNDTGDRHVTCSLYNLAESKRLTCALGDKEIDRAWRLLSERIHRQDVGENEAAATSLLTETYVDIVYRCHREVGGQMDSGTTHSAHRFTGPPPLHTMCGEGYQPHETTRTRDLATRHARFVVGFAESNVSDGDDEGMVLHP